MAFSSYRMVYASVWDFRFNHIPLHRNTPFVFGAGASSFDGFHDTVFTRKAGWGTMDGGSWGGAPFDAANGPRGTMPPHPEGPVAGHGSGVGQGHHDDGVYGTGSSRVQRKPIGTHGHGHGEQMV